MTVLDEVTVPGPNATDAELAAWRDAAVAGRLPTPTRRRWQALRAGVVNLWEFDTAEYWFADGRAQFVGANQSGKSTLMALTTLIQLAGDLDRQMIDTFGQSHKSFRYYVEPTDEPADRRETGPSTNRGWAWVEYARLGEHGPEYFTTLLYAQAKRGVRDLSRTWAVCRGAARVRDGLHLLDGQAVRTPGDLADVLQFSAYPSGAAYASAVSSGLFGFDSVERLEAATRMLKVLRTPHLGQQLAPDWFTAQMRSALPAIAQSEIDELADGWEQLDRLALDRDSAAEARDAVQAYRRRSWNPWADAVLRRAADDLVAANTRFDRVTRTEREAQDRLCEATAERERLDRELADIRRRHDETELEYEQLVESSAYTEAHLAAERVERLGREARTAATVAADRAGEARHAGEARERTEAARRDADTTTATAARARDETVTDVAAASGAAGLPEAAPEWAAAGDTARLEAAITERRGQVAAARRLQTALDKAMAEQEKQAALLAQARRQHDTRSAQAARMREALETALQTLSDAVESWAGTLGDAAPETAVRDRWIADVTAQAAGPHPQSILGSRLRVDWLEPATSPLREQAALAAQAGGEHEKCASDAEAEAARLLAETDPVPEPPAGWTRRGRPAAGSEGAPLWRLLDPVGDLGGSALDCVEAALAASGLLDAWVTADGAWVEQRDGADAVATLGAARPDRSLAGVLRAADDAGPLGPAVTQLLASVAYGDEPSAPYVVCRDGRWRTPVTSGRAAPAPHGAALLGSAARAAARARRVEELRRESADRRELARTAYDTAESLRADVTALEAAAAFAPGDAGVVHAAIAAATAARELAEAASDRDRRETAALAAEAAASDAHTALLTFCTGHGLPHQGGFDAVVAAVDAAYSAVAALKLASRELAASLREQEAATAAAAEAAAAADRRTEAAAAAAKTASDLAVSARTAAQALDRGQREVIEGAEALRSGRVELRAGMDDLHRRCQSAQGVVGKAEEALARQDDDRAAAETGREAALTAWWVPVDAEFASARGVPPAAGRLLSHAVAQAQVVRREVRPPGWPEGPESAAEKERKVTTALTRMTGPALMELRTALESTGGRSATVVDADETGSLPDVLVLVDATGAQVRLAEAVARLDRQATELAQLHDEKMQQVLVELLSSTFVEHLRDRLAGIVHLLKRVNDVLRAHPTGANRTTLQLRRVPAEGQRAGFDMLGALERGIVGSPAVQQQIRSFLEQQIREAQELGRTGQGEWKEHLARLLDHRAWFDVVPFYRVGQGDWRPLTREVHAKDSGGGKVVTLLQPLLATLVAIYDESESAPRPLWLDEAFEGVDAANRATMLDLFVTFDLDFLLAGPGPLVTAAQVPAAAVWFISRAPEPVPGVDLSLMLWAGRDLVDVPIRLNESTGVHLRPEVVSAQNSLWDGPDG